MLKRKQKLRQKENKSSNEQTISGNRTDKRGESYDVAIYIGILSFLWDVSCRLVRILVRSSLRIHFLIFQTLIGKFVIESAPSTIQILVLPLPIGIVD